jgi:hypothetical protein
MPSFHEVCSAVAACGTAVRSVTYVSSLGPHDRLCLAAGKDGDVTTTSLDICLVLARNGVHEPLRGEWRHDVVVGRGDSLTAVSP